MEGTNKNMEGMKICQSCGMPMTEEEHFGKNADGTKNEEYCCYCLRDGELGECTLEQMLDICAPIEVEQGRAKTLEEARERYGKYLLTLGRWKK